MANTFHNLASASDYSGFLRASLVFMQDFHGFTDAIGAWTIR